MSRRTPRILIGVGLLLVLVAVLLAIVARQLVVGFPDAFDVTAHATGSLTLRASPATGAPQPGATLPLDLRRRLHRVSESNGQVVVQENDAETVGPLPALQLMQQYVLDTGTGTNVSSPQAYAYTPGNVVDRSGSSSVTFPFDAGTGPYPVWRNEIGTTVQMTSTTTTSSNGLSVRRFRGHTQDLPLQPAYLAQLGRQGLPQTLSIQQLTPVLTAAGIDPGAIDDAIAQLDDPADRGEAQALFHAPVPIAYLVTSDESLLVEPVSGVVVSLERIDETVTMTPQPASLGRLQLILGQARYASKPVVGTGAAALARLAARPPATPVYTVTYGQDSASVARTAAYARDRANHIRLWTWTLPLVLAVIGVIALVIGLVMRVVRRRRYEVT